MSLRYPDWPSRLEAFFRANLDRRFKYGDWDCCLFVCDAIQAMTGVDPAERLRGRYRTRITAMEAIRAQYGQLDVREVAEAIAEECGFEACPSPLSLRRGDAVLFERSRDWSLGLMALDGKEVIVAGPRGLVMLPLKAACGGWHI